MPTANTTSNMGRSITSERVPPSHMGLPADNVVSVFFLANKILRLYLKLCMKYY
jgi:hypothetical protein